jgi:regulator of replication initiation timing
LIFKYFNFYETFCALHLNPIFFALIKIGEPLELFFNAILSTPLPKVTFQMTVNFFNIQDRTLFESLGTVIDVEIATPLTNLSPNEVERKLSDILSLIENCNYAISKAKRQASIAASLSSEPFVCSNVKTPNNCYSSSSNQYSIVVHDTLMAIMGDRDEAQSQLMAERIFHTHELDQERRKVEVLEKKLEYLHKVNNAESASAAAFFLGQEDIPSKNSLGKIEQTMVQNVDAELTELCRQLSSEISVRVALELEVLRLKESQKIEREIEIKEKQELYYQINFYKEKMEEAITERDSLRLEYEKWKKSFEKIVLVDHH